MRSKARIKDHPIHCMLVALPLGLWTFSFIADILYVLGIKGDWHIVSGYCMGGGILGALLAAVFGFIDYTGITHPRTKTIATWHMMTNLAAVVLYCFNFYMRYSNDFLLGPLEIMLSVATMILLSASGWLGGELVYVHRVAVVEESEKPIK